MRFKVAVALAFLGGLFAAQWTTATESAEWTGELSSSVFRALPADIVFGVVIYNDTEANLVFRRQFLAALTKAGYAVSEDAPLVFTFGTNVTWREARLRELEEQRRRRFPADREEFSFPDERDRTLPGGIPSSMFGDRPLRPPRAVSRINNREQDRLDITVDLRERKTSRIMWEADLALPFLDDDRDRIARSIIGPVISAIGKDTERLVFPIR
jgi:hypothetical protein